MKRRTRDASQKPGLHVNQCKVGAMSSSVLPKASQKNMHPAFFVLHHEGKPLTKSVPSDAWGSLLAFLHPASVHAEMVVTNLNVNAREVHA